MSYFYSVRGWLEASPSDFSKVVSTITSLRERWQSHDKERLYMKGWCWSDEPVNWTRYLFYGADVTEDGLRLLCDTIRELTLLKVEISGYFHARGEDGEDIIIYRVDNDVLTEERAPAHGAS
ncbi:hypothetical protein [Sorangium sp. So ce1000]|uniref:hypothetical protein n=1 Tax=Sorangium sp. So ce1000 TaxID=3133325 RepID=UPI003F60698B